MVEILVSALVSVFVGLGLWLWLPRGVVLVRERDTDALDTWKIRNDSPLAIRLYDVSYVGVGTYDERTDRCAVIPLKWDEGDDEYCGVDMSLDDETDEIGRNDWQRPWNKIVLKPGDTMTAEVGNNTSLVIKYRRHGWAGVLERRTLQIHGGV